MKISDVMSSPVFVVKPRDTVSHARALLERHRINQLAVIVDGRLVGIVTDRDLRDAFAAALPIHGRRRDRALLRDPEQVSVEDVMTHNVLTLEPRDSLESAARLMRRERIGSVPIVENGRLAGIVSRSDVLAAYVSRSEKFAATQPPTDVTFPPGPTGEVTRNA